MCCLCLMKSQKRATGNGEPCQMFEGGRTTLRLVALPESSVLCCHATGSAELGPGCPNINKIWLGPGCQQKLSAVWRPPADMPLLCACSSRLSVRDATSVLLAVTGRACAPMGLRRWAELVPRQAILSACCCLRTDRQRLPAEQVPMDCQKGGLPCRLRLAAILPGSQMLFCACRIGRRPGMRLLQALRRGHTGQP